MASLPPGLLLVLGAPLVALLRGRARQAVAIALPLVGLALLLGAENGEHARLHAFGHELVLARIDGLSRVFGVVFHLAAFLTLLYAARVRGGLEPVATLLYAGGAIGAVFAGDLISFFLWWEVVGVAPVFLILARRTPAASAAAFRYLFAQIVSGVLLLAGIALRLQATGSLAFEAMHLGDPGTVWIFLAFGIKCGWPLLHGWIPDAYPEATEGGAVALSAFTTKLAVYALARGFAGAEPLIWIGAAMALFPVFYAIVENDLRRVLAYSMINQIGYMVCAIGVGTPLAIDAAAAHAFSHILYKALLFMSLGAVLHRTGRTKATELGGLARSMPWTAALCGVGAASISGVPLFCGFVTKGLVLAAVAEDGPVLAWAALLIAAAAALAEVGFRVPWSAFFRRDAGLAPAEAPRPMLVAMGLAALACLLIGVAPGLLLDHLPHPVEGYRAWTLSHVLEQMQILVGAALAIAALLALRLWPAPARGRLLDVDALYVRVADAFVGWVRGPFVRALGWASAVVNERIPARLAWFARNPAGAMSLVYERMRLGLVVMVGSIPRMRAAEARYEAASARYEATRPGATWPIGRTVLFVTLALLVYLVIDLARR